MTLRSPLHSCARFAVVALALNASMLAGCAPGEEIDDLQTIVQGIEIRVAPGGSIAAAVG